MSKQVWKPATLLAPVPPVMVSCGTMDQPNIITVAWTGIVNSDPAMTYISVRPERYSYDIIKRTGDFVINLTTAGLTRAADFCGVRTGARIDKFKEMKLTPEKAGVVRAPMIAESPLNIECRVEQVIHLGSHDMFLAKILAVHVDEQLIDKEGKLCLHRAALTAYAHGEYYELGRRIGKFGYSVRKKKPAKKYPQQRKGAPSRREKKE